MRQINKKAVQANLSEGEGNFFAFIAQSEAAPLKFRVNIVMRPSSLQASKRSSKWQGDNVKALKDQLNLEIIEFDRATLSLKCSAYFFKGHGKPLNADDPNDFPTTPIFLKAEQQSRAIYEPALTKRELGVLQMVGDGFSAKEAAQRLSISPFTVSDHLKVIYGKLKVHNRTRAIIVARELGIL